MSRSGSIKQGTHSYRGVVVSLLEVRQCEPPNLKTLAIAEVETLKLKVKGTDLVAATAAIEERIDEYLANGTNGTVTIKPHEASSPAREARICQRCRETDISHRPRRAKYCEPCADKSRNERRAERRRKQRAKELAAAVKQRPIAATPKSKTEVGYARRVFLTHYSDSRAPCVTCDHAFSDLADRYLLLPGLQYDLDT